MESRKMQDRAKLGLWDKQPCRQDESARAREYQKRFEQGASQRNLFHGFRMLNCVAARYIRPVFVELVVTSLITWSERRTL